MFTIELQSDIDSTEPKVFVLLTDDAGNTINLSPMEGYEIASSIKDAIISTNCVLDAVGMIGAELNKTFGFGRKIKTKKVIEIANKLISHVVLSLESNLEIKVRDIEKPSMYYKFMINEVRCKATSDELSEFGANLLSSSLVGLCKQYMFEAIRIKESGK